MKLYVLSGITPNHSYSYEDLVGEDKDLLGVYSSPEKVCEKIEDNYGRMMPNKQFHTNAQRRTVIDMLETVEHDVDITKKGETYWKYLVEIKELDEV